MPKRDIILNLPGFSIQKVSGYNPVVLDVVYRRKARCPTCHSTRLRKKSKYQREVRHELIGLRCTVLRFEAYKFYCYHCQRYFNQQFEGINKYQRITERLRYQIFDQHTKGVSQKELARDIKTGKTTIERWYHQVYRLKNQQFKQSLCPSVLGIDEHFFNHQQGYATTFCDLRKHC